MQKSVHQFTAGKISRQPGTEGLWIFIFIDMIIFLLIFIVFMGERMRLPNVFSSSQLRLNEFFGLANTLILLTSSWMVVEAIQAAKRQLPRKVKLHLWAALLLGLMFAVNKFIEYESKFNAGITPATNPFYSFYFFITLVHFLHVLAGMLFLFSFKNNAPACATSGQSRYITGLENTGLFWHYVDILWIFIFPLLYLVGR